MNRKKSFKIAVEGADVPEPPADLPPEVKAAWRRLAPLLSEAGSVGKADAVAVHLLARAYADWLAYCDKVPVGQDVFGGVGTQSWNMAAAARDKAEARLREMLTAFGLTPKARQRMMAAQKKAPADRKGKYFKAV